MSIQNELQLAYLYITLVIQGAAVSDALFTIDEVIAFIKWSLKLPEKEDQRYRQLRRKREIEDLSDDEFSEYQDYIIVNYTTCASYVLVLLFFTTVHIL